MRKIVVLFVVMMLSCFALSAQEVVRSTFRYATRDGQKLYFDRYMLRQEAKSPRPCMIFAYGGGFDGGKRNDEYYLTYFKRLARQGIVVISIDYRLNLGYLDLEEGVAAVIEDFNNEVCMSVEDMYTATKCVVANAKKWKIDTSKIMISGSSVGAMAAIQAEWMRCNGHELSKILPEGFKYAAVVGCAGAIFSTEGKPKFETNPAPMFLFHGTSDRNIPYDHCAMFGVGFYGSAYIIKQLQKLNSPYWFYSAEYADHELSRTPLKNECDLIIQFINDYVIRDQNLQIRTDVVDLNGEKLPTHFTVIDYIKANYAF